MTEEMAMVTSLLSRGLAEVPDIYRAATLASVARPRHGVDVALVTTTHLVEICEGLVVRSSLLTHSGQVKDLRLVLGEMEDWRYLVVREGGVQFISMQSLTLVKEYQGVESVELGDFHHNGRRLVKLTLLYGDVILTDGNQEYDLIDIDVLSLNEDEEEEAKPEVLNVITARLKQISEAVEAARADLEAKEKMIEETLTNLALEAGLDSEVVVGEREKETGGGSGVTVTVTEHWLRLVNSDRSEVVLGLRLLGVGDSLATQLSLNLQLLPDLEAGRPLLSTSSLLSLNGPASVTSLPWQLAGGRNAYLMSVLPLSQLVSSSGLAASVSYFSGDSGDHRTTQTIHIPLHTKFFLSSSVQIKFGGQEDILNFLSLSVTGRTETLKVRTELGSLSRFVELLEQNQFSYSPSLASHVFISPGHVLHLALVSVTQHTGQQLSLSLLARDFTILGLLLNLIKKFLPSDVKFTRVNKISSQL